ncbi:hypothetical protein [Floridanema evergladense]|uniref:Uncharacterized protein n=1 Tax=Floridaenema evergladense BLCC-F167 TaxID=3153639 RepID=A0ABV4WTU5_9CYAN
MMEQQLLEQLAQDNQQLTAKCAELEKQLANHKSEGWLIFFVELALLFGLGLFIGNWQGKWQGYDEGYAKAANNWKREYCELKHPKSVEDFRNCMNY